MNFRRESRIAHSNEPEINLIPFIDVLLVVLIFLMLSTTYSKFTEIQLKLPVADTDAQRDYPKEVIVAVSSDGRYSINKSPVPGRSVDAIGTALVEAAKAGKESVIIISADALASHLCRAKLGAGRSPISLHENPCELACAMGCTPAKGLVHPF
jgi:biopolymer transport protein ExbD